MTRVFRDVCRDVCHDVVVGCCHDTSGFVMTRLVVQVRVGEVVMTRWRAEAESRGLSLSEFVRGAVEAEIDGSAAHREAFVAARSGETVGWMVEVPAAPAFVPSREEPVAAQVTSARPPVDVGALLERGREERAQAGRREPRPKARVAGEMCEHRVSAEQFCKRCDGEAAV